jgi:hypothetical protein
MVRLLHCKVVWYDENMKKIVALPEQLAVRYQGVHPELSPQDAAEFKQLLSFCHNMIAEQIEKDPFFYFEAQTLVVKSLGNIVL